MTEKNAKQNRYEGLAWFFLTILAFGILIPLTGVGRNAIATELHRRPAIGFLVFRGEYTVMIMNRHFGEVYWFTNCPRLKDFTRHEEFAIYGDHLNRCHDWRTLTPSEYDISKK